MRPKYVTDSHFRNKVSAASNCAIGLRPVMDTPEPWYNLLTTKQNKMQRTRFRPGRPSLACQRCRRRKIKVSHRIKAPHMQLSYLILLSVTCKIHNVVNAGRQELTAFPPNQPRGILITMLVLGTYSRLFDPIACKIIIPLTPYIAMWKCWRPDWRRWKTELLSHPLYLPLMQALLVDLKTLWKLKAGQMIWPLRSLCQHWDIPSLPLRSIEYYL